MKFQQFKISEYKNPSYWRAVKAGGFVEVFPTVFKRPNDEIFWIFSQEHSSWTGVPMSSLNVVKEEIVVTKRDIYKVPLFKKGNIFAVWTGEGVVRYFNEETLPDVIKVPLGIVMNSTKAAELNQKDMSEMDMAKGVLQDELFKDGGWDPSYKEIGWQYNKYYYVVVLTAEELASIKGGEKEVVIKEED